MGALMQTILPGRVPRGVFLLLLLFCCGVPQTSAQTKEYQLKAAFLFNFAQFTDLPESAFTSTNAPFVIGIFGDNPFGTALEEITRDEEIAGHKFEVRSLKSPAEARACQMVFIPRDETDRWPQIRRSLGNRPVVTVGESENFSDAAGGMIRLYIQGNRVRFRINTDAAKTAGISFSSKLLRLAEEVVGEAAK